MELLTNSQNCNKNVSEFKIFLHNYDLVCHNFDVFLIKLEFSSHNYDFLIIKAV